MKRRHSTAQVVAILSRRHDWTAKAPDTDYFYPCTVSTDGKHIGFVTHFPPGDNIKEDRNPPIRDDWEIVKPKLKRVVVGKLAHAGTEWDLLMSTVNLDKSKTYKLVAVEQ